MTRRSVIILYFIPLFISCSQTRKGAADIAETKETSMEGFWILSNYIDTILATRSIEPFSVRSMLACGAIVLKIDQDSIQTQGLLWAFKLPLSNNSDSLATTVEGNYKLSYNKREGTIHAMDLEGEDSMQYIFRKAGKADERLVANIEDKPPFDQLEKNVYHFFIDKIISGTYRPLTKTSDFTTLKLLPDGTTTGFKQFNAYRIHDYFGTLHPYEGDAIIFVDTNKPVREDRPPDNYAAFQWEFIKDSLVLTEYITEDLETYRPGTKQYKFLKE